MKFLVGNKIIAKGVTKELHNWCMDNLVLFNPDYAKKERMGLWTGSTPRNIFLYEKNGSDLILPFGCIAQLRSRFPDAQFMAQNRPKFAFNYHSHISLYPYQENAVLKALEGKNGILVMPCGAGKTQTGLEVIARIGGRALWLTHTQDLLNQSMNRAKSVFGCSLKSYGTITGGKVNIGEGITFATVQTMARIDLTELKDAFGCIVVDECFPGDTIVATINGQKEIKNLLHGDLVASYNRDSGRIEFKPVVNTFRLVAHDLLKVTLCNGTTVDATSNHPFFVKGKGWIRAEEMEVGDYVMQLVRQGVQRNEKAKHDKSANKKTWLRLLLPRLRVQSDTSETGVDGGTSGKVCGAHEESERRISRTNHGTDDKKKSNERPGSKSKGIGAIEGNWAQAEGTWWKRHRNDCATKNAHRRTLERIDGLDSCCGISDSDKDGKRFRLSDLLQGRYCTRGTDDRYRNRRIFSLFYRKAKSGCEENSVFNWIRVDSIEVQKQTSDGTFGGLCADSYVYNIEVADNNNYFANGILVHNCHKAIGSPTKVMQFYKVLSALSCRYKFGLTATPKRADGLEQSMFALLGGIIAEVSREEVADTTCEVRVEFRETNYMPNYDVVLAGDGTLNYAVLVEDMTQNQERFDFVLNEIERLDGSVLVLGNRVDYLRRLSDAYSKESICLSALGQSKSAKEARKQALKRLNDGELSAVFATYALAREGLDVPNLRYVVFSTPEKDPTTIEQSTGRVGRKADGKSYGTVIDFVDDFGMYKGWWKKRLSVYKKIGCDIIE